jgi:ferric-dicitrate binding protein FerR (iron transport regulator)
MEKGSRLVKMKEQLNITLLGKFLSGACTPEEKEQVQRWIEQSPENRTVFEEYRKVWKYSGMDDDSLAVDVDEGWNELNKRIRMYEALGLGSAIETRPVKRHMAYMAMRVAAVFVLAFGLLYFLFNNLKQNRQITPSITHVASDVSDHAFVLADGTEIFFDKGAKITYPESFSPEVREIDFEGEAYFQVAHNPEKPFIIHCGNVDVEVMGTAFDLCSCPADDQVILHLEEGKVRFSSKDKESGRIVEQILLKPGEKAVYDKATGLITRAAFKGTNYLAWKTGVLTFEKTPLSEVFSILEQTYDIRIDTEKTYDDLALTARFDHETPESIFKVLHTIFNINYTIHGNDVAIR